MCIVGAIVAAGVIGAAGTAYAGSEAAGATKDASNAAIQQQQSALQQQATLSQPYRDLGTAALPTLESLLGITPPQSQAPAYRMGPGGQMIPQVTQGPTADPTAALRNMPGYQFALGEGINDTKNAAAASGLLLSGNTLEGLSKFTTGLADQTYQREVGNLENVVGMGQAAAAGQAANIGNSANNVSNILTNQGNTLAGIDANTAAGITKAIGNAGNQYVMNQTLAGLGNPSYGSPWAGVPTDPSAGTYWGGMGPPPG